MKLNEAKAGMRIKAVGDWADCWKDGDEFTVFEDKRGEAYVECHDHKNGPHHGLEGTAGEDDDIPFDAVT